MRSEVNDLSRSLKHAGARDRAHILVDWQAFNRQDLNQLSGDLFNVTESTQIYETQDKLLDSLYFTRLEERRDRIPEAHKQTFRWIFGGLREDGTRWDEFSLWLGGRRAHKSLFWISGKAGSGKSTLMRYLDNNENTKSCLRTWAGNKDLVVGSCFFWKAGTPIQKSLTGMLRSLLHQILMQKRSFIADTDPLRWRSLYWGSLSLEDWTDVELIKAMQNVVRAAQPTARLALFVDGLDEFDGDDEQMQSLIDFFHGLAEQPNVKVCVSSRPWNIFQDAFAECPKLRLELLTLEDIRLYVQDTLDKSPRFRQLSLVNQLGCLGLVTDVVEKAMGVFLWVYFVVRELVKGLRNGYDLRMLRKRLDQLPADLDAFFLQMIDTIEHSDRPAASKAFQIVLAGQQLTTLMTLAFIEAESVDFALQMTPSQSILRVVIDTNESMLRRVNSLCMGLLEARRPHEDLFRDLIQNPGRLMSDTLQTVWKWEVDYLHRTVKDFLLGDQSQKILRSYTDGEYDTQWYLCNSFLTQMILASSLADKEYNSREQGVDNAKLRLVFDFFEDFMHAAEKIEQASGASPVTLLSKTEKVLLDQISTVNADMLHLSSRGLSRVWESIDKWYDWNCSFMTLTLEYDLEGYYSYRSKSRLQIPRKGRPCLDFALRRWASRPLHSLPPKPHLIKTLLLDGASPTDVFENDSLWGHYLLCMARQFESDENKGEFPEKERSAWYETTELLITYGALYNRFSSRENEVARNTLQKVFGLDTAEKLLRTPTKPSLKWNQPSKTTPSPTPSRRHGPSLRDKLLPWRSRSDRS